MPRSGAAVKTEATAIANEAFRLSLIGILCFGIIVEPIAYFRAKKALEMMDASPFPVEGYDRARSAKRISTVMIVIWALFTVLRVVSALTEK